MNLSTKSLLIVGAACIIGIPFDCLASCGAATCPLDNHQYLRAGILSIGWSHEYINQDQIYIGSSLSYVGAIQNGHHDEVSTLNERDVLQFQSGLTGALGLGVSLPFIHREHQHIGHEGGGNTWEGWDYSGLGDMTISLQYAIINRHAEFSSTLDILAGAKLSTGVTNERNAEGEEAEVTIQPGSGSRDIFLGMNFRQTLLSVPMISGAYGALPLTLGVLYQLNGEGKDGYRFGNALQAHIGSSYQFAERASFLLQVNGKFQDYADVGTTGEPRENTGGTWLFLSPGLGVQLSDAFSGSMYYQTPVYQNVHGIQQTAKFNLLFDLRYQIDLSASSGS